MSLPIIAVLFMLRWATSASADAQADFDNCGSAFDREEWELVLHYCGRAIQSGQLTDSGLATALVRRCGAFVELKQPDRALEDCNQALRLDPNNAVAYNNRGIAYQGKGQYDRAIQDYDQALRLDPNDALAYHNRGNAYQGKGQYDRAIQDYDQALRLDPNYARPLFQRGNLHFFRGRFDESARDLAAYVQREPAYAYGPLWLFVARQRAGLGGARELDVDAEKLDLTEWPGPLIQFFQGELGLVDLRLVAERDDANRGDRVCEFNYYVGQAALIDGRPDRARGYLENAAADCPKNFIEYHGANAELARLPQ